MAFGVAHGGFALADELSARSGVTVSGAVLHLAILSGALINNLPGGLVRGALFKPGVAFASSTVLRAGIVAVGFKLSASDVAAVGAFSVPVVAASVGAGLAVIPRLARVAGLTPRLGSLLAVGTSVCGVTAVSRAGARRRRDGGGDLRRRRQRGVLRDGRHAPAAAGGARAVKVTAPEVARSRGRGYTTPRRCSGRR